VNDGALSELAAQEVDYISVKGFKSIASVKSGVDAD